MRIRTIRQLVLITGIISLLTIFAQPVLAGVVLSGNIDPADPTTWTSTTSGYIGKTADGTMEINEGSVVTDFRGYIGEDIGVTGEVTVDGTDSTWTNSSLLYVGDYGDGILDITNGGKVTNSSAYIGYRADSISSVTVEGAESLWENNGGISVGRYGSGTLDVKVGGTVTCTGESYIGHSSGSTGEVTVNGINSTCSHTTLIVGYYSNGMLDIRNGGMVSARDASVGRYAGSTGKVIVDGSGSTWNVNVLGGQGQVSVGLQGNGTLDITNGGTVNNSYGYIGQNAGSIGKVTVDKSNSAWTCIKYLYVGYYGDGTMNITGGGNVISEWDGGIGYELGSTGAVTVDGPGSTWTNNDALYVGRYGSGTLTITDGGLVSVDLALNIDTDADGDGFINIANGGMLAKKGNANGTLAGFLALVTGTDAIRYWNSTFGNWDAITSATPGADYTLTYETAGELAGYTMLTVHVPGPPDPDVHQNGGVDMLDFADLAYQWLEVGCVGPDWCGRADIDYSGDVGFSDMLILTENWLEGVE